MNNTSLYMQMGQGTMGDLWAPEFLLEMTYHKKVQQWCRKVQKYVCTNLDMDNNASPHRCIKWIVKHVFKHFVSPVRI